MGSNGFITGVISKYHNREFRQDMIAEFYHEEPYASEFSAKVIETGEDWIVLDRTLFYPGGGGQEHDKGSINDTRVTEVFKDNGKIIHKVPGHSFSIGEDVHGKIAWKRRYELMRGHTGEHMLFSALKKLNPELELIKISIAEDKKFLIVKGEVDWDIAAKAQEMILDWIAQDLEIYEEIVSKDDPLLEEIRIKKERISDDKVRVIKIGDVDASACSGIHVKSTAEIEFITISKLNSAKPEGDWEIEFLIGNAAKQEAAGQSAQFMKLVSALGAQKGNLVTTVENLKSAKEKDTRALKKYMDLAFHNLTPTIIGDITIYKASFPELDKKVAADHINELLKENTICIIGSDGDRYTLTIACSPDVDLDCAKILNEVLAADGGKGGGKRNYASGGAGSESGATLAVQKAYEAIQMSLTEKL